MRTAAIATGAMIVVAAAGVFGMHEAWRLTLERSERAPAPVAQAAEETSSVAAVAPGPIALPGQPVPVVVVPAADAPAPGERAALIRPAFINLSSSHGGVMVRINADRPGDAMEDRPMIRRSANDDPVPVRRSAAPTPEVEVNYGSASPAGGFYVPSSVLGSGGGEVIVSEGGVSSRVTELNDRERILRRWNNDFRRTNTKRFFERPDFLRDMIEIRSRRDELYRRESLRY